MSRTIPQNWTPYRRDEDDELLGYLKPHDDSSESVVPVTIFGYELAGPAEPDDAERVLDSLGLSYLAERWLLSLEDRDEPINVQLIEASPQQLVVKSVDFGYEENYGALFTLDVPVDDRIRMS